MEPKIWITSDLHFGHKNIIQYCNRPFQSVPEMNQALLEELRSKVGPEDTLFFLGDLAFKNFDPECLPGKQVIWVRGNHDKKYISHRITQVPYWEETYNGTMVVMFHYPIEEWNQCHRGSVHLHGHCHGTGTAVKNRLDVGWDCFGRILQLDEAIELAKAVEGETVKHHQKGV